MYEFFGFQVEIDQSATQKWYAVADEWGCTCGDCRNFLALAHTNAFPAPVLAILDQLGIPPEKATYVCTIYPDGKGYCYQFSYRIAGRIISGKEQAPTITDWGSAQCCHEPYPYGAPDFPEPHFDLEFCITLPFVL